jgi:hypothetical protein
MRKKIYFKVWFVKQFGIIVMYSIFDVIMLNGSLLAKKTNRVLANQGSNLGTNNCMLII